jgi:UDP-N-acetylmuramoyl-tripeptide--D-alanyl-D-alanine ligase
VRCALIAVSDTRRALGQLAARYRTDFKLPVTAVAGSNGKTTTKEILAAVLRQKFSTLWSEASFNNDIGVPLTLLNLEARHAAAVFELGTNHPGELAPLIRMVRPEIGVITSIGREHLEFFGSIAGVAEEEGSLAELLPAQGILVINGDSEWTPAIAKRCKAEVVRVGRNDANDWRVRKVDTRESGISFQVDAPEQRFSGEYSLPLFGAHQAINATLALAVAAKLGLNTDQIRKGFAEAKAPKMRLQMREFNGIRVLDDSYNANADSMMAALQTLHDLPAEGRRVAVLGDMAELGEHTEAAHKEVGAKAAELGLAQLFTVGTWARQTAEAARAKGMESVSAFPDAEEAIVELKKFLRPGDLLLLKASRVAGLERVSAALQTVQ